MTLPAGWRVVESLNQLRRQLDQLHPHRSKVSDGTVADARHSTTSDHYPHYVASLGSHPVVTARDVTHDDILGVDCDWLAEALRRSKDPRIKYVIFKGRIFSNPTYSYAGTPWQWRPYGGTNPHTSHLHLSVLDAVIADSASPWQIGPSMTTPAIDPTAFARMHDRVYSLHAGVSYNAEPVPHLYQVLADIKALLAAPVVFQVEGIDYEHLAEALQPVIATELEGALARLQLTMRPGI